MHNQIEVDCIVLEAKQAILEHEHEKFIALKGSTNIYEIFKQFHRTVVCATSVLLLANSIAKKLDEE